MLVDRMIETKVSGDEEMPTEGLNEKRSINEEMQELAKYVEVITKTIREMESPVTSTSDQLPQATSHLHDLAKMTEEGTHKVLSLTEELERNREVIQYQLEQLRANVAGRAVKDLDAILTLVKADEKQLLNIHVALSFQDLVAQRVGKLVTILNEIQHKLLKLVVIFGIQQQQGGPGASGDGRGYEMLRQLEISKTTALQQDLVDSIMSEFGLS
ncbi:MAG: protein phosphatase CheZ [Nitrospirales bacterium]|nr:protein phosphatase CheZ [Nitrospira sp.]MDR4461954.1 protein phosphatase CheZ [Nitrospirales bacterium]